MKERPILFSAPMVRALLDGTKTQTRRVMRDQPCMLWDFNRGHLSIRVRGAVYQAFSPSFPPVRCPYGQPGDRLWVRETWAKPFDVPDAKLEGRVTYRSDFRESHVLGMVRADGAMADRVKWKPSIYMPRWASRITLEVTGVRVERLQDISVTDAIAEAVNVHQDHHGKPRTSIYSPVQAYRDLWESINGPDSWDANPWVWVVEFKRAEGGAA